MGFSSFRERVDRCASNMGRMMDRLGTRYARAVRRCLLCRDAEACRVWLAASAASAEAAPEFCPNADFFGACAAPRRRVNC